MPRQSFRHRFFTRNLASRERASFEGFARSQGLEREKVNHDLTRSPVVARSPRPSLPPFPFPSSPRFSSIFSGSPRLVFLLRLVEQAAKTIRRDRENFLKTITNERTNAGSRKEVYPAKTTGRDADFPFHRFNIDRGRLFRSLFRRAPFFRFAVLRLPVSSCTLRTRIFLVHRTRESRDSRTRWNVCTSRYTRVFEFRFHLVGV